MSLDHTNPTLSLPTLSFGWERRTVVAPSHSDALVTFTESDEHGVDYSRMLSEAECDLLIYPTWSDGTETLLVLDATESLTIAPNCDDSGDELPGLSITVRMPIRGEQETWTVPGWVRVHRHRT